MSESPCDRALTPQMIRAFAQFNRGEYWHQHETLEAIWRAETDESIRNFYKGILQIGVGLHHLTRRNYPGAIKVLARGINYLQLYSPRWLGVDVARLIADASQVLAQLESLGAERIGEMNLNNLPRVHYE